MLVTIGMRKRHPRFLIGVLVGLVLGFLATELAEGRK